MNEEEYSVPAPSDPSDTPAPSAIPTETPAGSEPTYETPTCAAPSYAAQPAPNAPVQPYTAPAYSAPAYSAQPYAPSYSIPEETPPKKKKNGLWLALGIIFLCLALLLGVAAFLNAQNKIDEGGYGNGGNATVNPIEQSNTPTSNVRTDVSEGDKLTTQEIIAKVNPSVVTVKVEVRDSQTGQSGSGFGTGIIFSENGYILTNAHVVEDSTKVDVLTLDGDEYPAKIIGSDTDSDVAVIKIEATGLKPAEFGRSSALVPGDKVVAIGTPYEINLSHTVTEGIVSALRDKMQFPSLGFTLDVIQHSAPINSGNSGGPLINEYGQVIGINSIKILTYENLGFALPIDVVLPIAEELMKNGKLIRPAIGITGYSYADGRIEGVYVYTLVEGGPAEKAGLKVNDVIIEMDGESVTTIEELKERIQSHAIGDKITLRYFRNGKVSQTTVTLATVDQ